MQNKKELPPTDIVIVGGGIIGLSTCFELLDEGKTVTLIDPAPISGATHHAGGMLAPAAEVQFQQQLLVPLMNYAGELYPSLIERVSQYTDLPTGYRTDGTLVIGADRADAQHINALSAILDESAHAQELSPREARRLEPALSPRISSAVSLPGDHQVQPRLWARALEDAVRQRGAILIKDTVLSFDGNDPCTEVICEKHTINTENSTVILACGLGAAKITGWYRGTNPLALRPVYGDILRVRVPDQLYPLIDHVIRGFVEDRPVYLIPRIDHTLTIGATSREDSPTPKVAGVLDLLRDGARLVPGLEECEFVEATCGARPGTPDDLPYLGFVGSNLIISTGYFRHGILLSSFGAQVGKLLALGCGNKIPVDISSCDPLRHSLRKEQ